MNRIKSLFLTTSILVLSCTGSESPEDKTIEGGRLALLRKSTSQQYALDERLRWVDSALGLTEKHHPDSLTLALLYSKSYLHYKLRQLDSSSYYDRLLKNMAQKRSNTFYLGKAHANLGFEYRDRLVYDSAYYHFNQSKNHFQTLGDSSEVGKRLLSMGIIQQDQSDYFGSKETLTEALRYLRHNDHIRSLASVYNELGTDHKKLLNFEDAIYNYKKAIAITPSDRQRASYRNNLATVYLESGKYEDAVRLLKPLLSDSLVAKQQGKYARVLDNFAYAQWKSGAVKDAENLMRALSIRKEAKDYRGQIASYTHLGEYFSEHDPEKAQRYLDTVIELSRDLKMPKAEQDALSLLIDLRSNHIAVRDRYIFLQDSLYQNGLQVKTQFAKMKYDDELTRQALYQLEMDTAKKEAELAGERFQKVLFISLGSVVLFAATFFFYGIKQRHRKEKLREVYATEKRISKKVHDELANDIYGIMTHVEHSKTFKKEQVLDSLDDIYNRTRDISHQNGGVDTQNYEEELRRLLSRFKNHDTVIAVKGLSDIEWQAVEEEHKVIVYRVVNELLVNMKKHSAASLVSLRFEQLKKSLKIHYTDNGSGLSSPLQKGAGLLNTETRIKNIGGTFSFDSEPGNGVTVRFALPL